MAHVIAVAGKGGVGKTTLCGLLIQYLCEKGEKAGPCGGRGCQFQLKRSPGSRSGDDSGGSKRRSGAFC